MRKNYIILLLLLFLFPVASQAQTTLNEVMNSAEAKKLDRALENARKNSIKGSNESKAINNSSSTGKVPGTMNKNEGKAVVSDLQRQNAAKTYNHGQGASKPASNKAASDANNAALQSLLAKKYLEDGNMEKAAYHFQKAFDGSSDNGEVLKWTDAEGKQYYYREKAAIDREIKTITYDVIKQADSILDTLVKRSGYSKKIPLKIDPETLKEKMQSSTPEEAATYIKDAMKKALVGAGWFPEGVDTVVEGAASEEVEKSVSPAVDKTSERLQQLTALKKYVNENCQKECIK